MRTLSDTEITILEDHGCWAEDWNNVQVDDDFQPTFLRRVMFYGEITLGVFETSIEVSKDFYKHTGIYNATLRNVADRECRKLHQQLRHW